MTKPQLGLFAWNGSKENNIILLGEGRFRRLRLVLDNATLDKNEWSSRHSIGFKREQLKLKLLGRWICRDAVNWYAGCESLPIGCALISRD